MPASWPRDNANDADFAGSVALIGDLTFTASKSQNVYLLNRNHLGGIGRQYQIAQFGKDGDSKFG